jgi:adenylate kinase family enzyme
MTYRRIMILGPTGSGKTTLGRRIGAALGVPHLELDSFFHQPNWTPTPPDEFQAKVLAAIDAAPDGWVTDGNYSVVRRLLLPRADAIVWLRRPWRVSYWRLLKRTVTRAWRKEELWNGNRESFRLSFLSKESILLWGITHHRAHVYNATADLEAVPHTAPLIVLQTDREVDAFVWSLVEQPAVALPA